jgi:hypothetical protein
MKELNKNSNPPHQRINNSRHLLFNYLKAGSRYGGTITKTNKVKVSISKPETRKNTQFLNF